MTPQHPLAPKHPDGVLRVYVPGRISTPGQDVESIAATQGDMEQWLASNYAGETRVTRVGEQASGWLVDRESMRTIQTAIEADECDLVLVREARELYRNPRLFWGFFQDCIDRDVRVISVWDGIDTANEGWEMQAYVASTVHGIQVPETRRRVKSKATHTFHQGGMVLKVRYGYRKLTREEAASGRFGPPGLRIAKLAECTEKIREMRTRLLAGTPPQQVVDSLNEEQVPVGPYVTSGRWTVRLLLEFLRDPILSGRRRFRTEISRFVYGKGKHKPQANPTPLFDDCPELAHLSVAEHRELLDVLAAGSRKNQDAQKTGKDSPLWNVPRSATLWPGQAARCGACGGLMYRYGKFLKCRNAVSNGARTCWNHVLVSIDTVHEVVIPEVIRFLDRGHSSRTVIAREGWHSYQKAIRRTGGADRQRATEIAELEEEAKNLARALARNPDLEAVVVQLRETQTRLKVLRDEADRETARRSVLGEYENAGDVEAQLDGAIARMAKGSREFAGVLRRLIPRFVIQPVQALDSTQVRPRAVLTLSTAAWASAGEPPVEETIALDLFDPPVHIGAIAACEAARRDHPAASLRDLARITGVNYMGVKRARDYVTLMNREGLTDPYRVLTGKPAEASRWRDRKRDAP